MVTMVMTRRKSYAFSSCCRTSMSRLTWTRFTTRRPSIAKWCLITLMTSATSSCRIWTTILPNQLGTWNGLFTCFSLGFSSIRLLRQKFMSFSRIKWLPQKPCWFLLWITFPNPSFHWPQTLSKK